MKKNYPALILSAGDDVFYRKYFLTLAASVPGVDYSGLCNEKMRADRTRRSHDELLTLDVTNVEFTGGTFFVYSI
jgi:hypothetical protein